MIRLIDLKHRYQDSPFIEFKDWNIDKGSKWLLLGTSVSGKTTLIHMLAGILRPFSGEIFIDGNAVHELPAKEVDKFRSQHIGLVFQRPHLVKSLTVCENLAPRPNFCRLGQGR